MKFFVPVIFTLFLAPTSAEEIQGTTARVIINGVQGDLTPQDIQLVHDTIAALSPSIAPPSLSYLRVKTSNIAATDEVSSIDKAIFQEPLVAMRAKYRPSPAPPPKTCGGWGCGGFDPKNPKHQRGHWTGFGSDFSCGPLCHNDDKWLVDAAWTMLVTSIPKSETGKTEEKQVCDALRRYGSSALSQATSCSIAPMVYGPTVSSLCVDGAKSGEALVFFDVIGGNRTEDIATDDYLASLTDEEVAVIETSVTEAYNEAFAEIGLVLQSFHALDVAEPSTTDMSSYEGISSTVIIGEFYQLCIDVDLDGKSKELERMHHYFESKLCEKLHTSGLSTFEKVKTCAYRTFNNHSIAKKNMIRDNGSVSEQ